MLSTQNTSSPVVTTAAQDPVRICKIANRYLVFDYKDASVLRRQHQINGTLVGTAPQQPTQNVFLGLPIEIRPVEAEALIERKVAYIVDSAVSHAAALKSKDPQHQGSICPVSKEQERCCQKNSCGATCKNCC